MTAGGSAPHDLTALEQAAALRAGELDPVELVEHYEARAERLDAVVGAFATRTPERALEQARAARARLAAARAGGELAELAARAPLFGVPVPVKDLHAVAGVRMRAGSRVVDVVPEVDDHVVRRLAAAGATMTGKTSAPELGLPCYTEPDVAPPARSPWDLARSAGGSSGGAAAAVAAGLAPVAHGSDGGGSIRIPASACGLVGLKPSRGRVSGGPLPGAVGDLGVHGPLARTVADAAALLDAMAGAWPGDPFAAPPLPPGTTFLAAAGRPPGRLRVGRHRVPPVPGAVVAPEVVAAYDAASALLEDLGHDVEEVPAPFGPDVVPHFEVLWSVSALQVPLPPAAEPLLRPLTRWLRERGRAVSGLGLAQAQGAGRTAARRALEATAAYDVVLTPTLAQLPAPVGGLRDDDDPAADFAAQKAFTPFTSTANLTGQPALSLPLGTTAQGLPVGVQLLGRYGEEALLLALGGQLEAAAPWRGRVPALW
ncbi:amidase [Vallicoccus soli]|uniref:Amidase n=1 Tax=Vallicoccus soli TaxID=2339232 RepID=A0A3A3ZLP2_9ACTN|nr:amidase [Vallicoccus soli]RJK97122.1 amidase [Vallicoccus soli]